MLIAAPAGLAAQQHQQQVKAGAASTDVHCGAGGIASATASTSRGGHGGRRQRRHPGRGNAVAAQLAQPSVRRFEADACALDQARSRLVLAVWAAEQLRSAEVVRG
jgi:hypothetical protein